VCVGYEKINATLGILDTPAQKSKCNIALGNSHRTGSSYSAAFGSKLGYPERQSHSASSSHESYLDCHVSPRRKTASIDNNERHRSFMIEKSPRFRNLSPTSWPRRFAASFCDREFSKESAASRRLSPCQV
jgi:hypothetical protein